MTKCVSIVTLAGLGMIAASANAQVRITEWAYSALSAGGTGEFIEFTNIGASPVNMTGWSFDDDSQLPGVVDLSAFGLVAPGESVILTEADASLFRADWGLSAAIKIIGGNTTNLGRNDEINLFNGVTLIDRLTFGDQNFPGTIRTQNVTGITLPTNYGTNNVAGWFFSTNGDIYGSHFSASGDLGNPGITAIPAPGAVALLGLGGLMMGRRRR